MPQAAPLSLTDLPTVLKDQVINIADRLSGFHMQSSFANINLLSICRSRREIAQNRASEKILRAGRRGSGRHIYK